MRIAFDGACCGDGPLTGVARAFLNGLAAYAALFPGDAVLLLPTGAPAPALPGVEVVPAPRGAVRRQLGLPRLLRQLRADLLHSAVAAVPLRAPCPTIATAHDLPWLHPELGEASTPWRRFVVRRALAAASAVIVPSAFTAADVQRLLGKRCPPVVLVPHGTTRGPAPDATTTQARSGPFVALGDDRPRKNRATVQAAHAAALAKCPELPPLRFVGPPDDYVDEAEKARLLHTCRAVVQGSRFEGFGMPVLEALAHGAPVVCADIPPFREIAGDAALFADPRDPEAIAAALVRIHTDAPLRWRLAELGHQRAAHAQPNTVAQAWRVLHERLRR